MQSTPRMLFLMTTLMLFTFFFPWGGSREGLKGSFALPALALAADEEMGEEEPFAEEGQAVADPLQPVNRVFFQFNDKLYFWVLKPTAQVYSAILPEGVRICIKNAFYNILMPVRVVNCALQGKMKSSGVELGRFVINSTMGVGGLFDVASTNFQIPSYDEDLGQTLGRYGVKPLVYVVWPLFGPSNVRDSVGMVGDSFLNPLNYIIDDFWVNVAVRGGREVNRTSLRLGEYEEFKKSAIDPYVSMREAYTQYRDKEIRQ